MSLITDRRLLLCGFLTACEGTASPTKEPTPSVTFALSLRSYWVELE
jgi:hypothetical protein